MGNTPLTLRHDRSGKWFWMGILAVLFGTGLQAQNVAIIALDVDRDATTGCDVAVNDLTIGPHVENGFEVRLDIEVDAASPAVVSVTREDCVAGTFVVGAVNNSPGISYSSNAGLGGADVIEGLIAFEDLGSPNKVAPRQFIGISERFDISAAMFLSLSDAGQEDVVAPDNQVARVVLVPPPSPVPAVSTWGLLLLGAALTGMGALQLRRHPMGLAVLLLSLSLGTAGTIYAFNAQGKPLIQDEVGDATGFDDNADIVQAGATLTEDGLWLRFDFVELDPPTP